ncbi:MAG: hypothetical protein ACFBQW_07580 [Sphingomonadaceae bacterium]
MAAERASAALTRIERAIARIENAPRPRNESGSEEEMKQLRSSHDRLRGNVARAIERIDELLGREAER